MYLFNKESTMHQQFILNKNLLNEIYTESLSNFIRILVMTKLDYMPSST